MAKRKRKSAFWKLFVLLALLLIVSVVTYQNRRYFRKAYRYFTYHYQKHSLRKSEFPRGYSIHGIDLSRYQADIDWKKLKAVDADSDTVKFQFAFIKATEGLILEDEMFDEHWHNAKKSKVLRGAYHYFLPNRNAKLQATNFITSVKLSKGDLPPVVDIEETKGKSKAQIVAVLKEFLTLIEAHYKVRPIIYSNIGFIEDYLSDDFADYKFWIAHYYQPRLYVSDEIDWLFWQHSDRADLLGCDGTVDANVFKGDEEDLRALLMK